MRRFEYPEPVVELIANFKRLPGVGPKSAERIAIWLLQAKGTVPEELAQSVAAARSEVSLCGVCGFFSTAASGCQLCTAIDRDNSCLCVVEQATDVLPLERTGVFRGLYHALGGKISPLDNVSPEDLRIDALLARLRQTEEIEEVILAVGSDVEGEATANYLAEVLRDFESVKVTRIAQGMPAGGGLESADELTLYRALDGRRAL